MTIITTDMLRFIAYTLGIANPDVVWVWASRHGVTIDDTPADTEEQTMGKMTITQEHLTDKAKHYGLPELAAANFVASLGITITPAEPPAEMVKLADDAWKAAPAKVRNVCVEHSWQDGYVAALQHADKAMDDAVAELTGTTASLKPHNLYGAFKRKIGAGGRALSGGLWARWASAN